LNVKVSDRDIVLNDPVNFIDPLGLVVLRPKGPVGPNGASAPYYVGRKGTPVPEGEGTLGGFLDNYAPFMHDMGYIHDNAVDSLTKAGWSDWMANIPTMLPAYWVSVLRNLAGNGQKYTPCPADNGDDEPNLSGFTHMGGTIFDN
jgi:hypothetical protein